MADKIVHFDVTGPDIAPLANFYSKLFGWNVGDRNGGYAHVETGGELQGGLVESEYAGVNFGIQVNNLQAALDAGMGDGNVPEIFDYFLKLGK